MKPEFCATEIGTDAPKFSHEVPAAGSVVPAPDGVNAMVSWYCCWYVAVTVSGEAGTVYVNDAVVTVPMLAEDQFWNVYWHPVPQLTVGAATRAWVSPGFHDSTTGVVNGVLSTVT